jgi:small subunit ribosomal protein S6
MKHRYEGLLVLNIKGSEDSAKAVISRLEAEFKKDGCDIEQVQRMERRHFSYVAGPNDSGYYVNFIFEAEPAALEKLKSKLKLDEEVYRQNYLRLGKKQPAKAA